jgi:hypothetical protein
MKVMMTSQILKPKVFFKISKTNNKELLKNKKWVNIKMKIVAHLHYNLSKRNINSKEMILLILKIWMLTLKTLVRVIWKVFQLLMNKNRLHLRHQRKKMLLLLEKRIVVRGERNQKDKNKDNNLWLKLSQSKNSSNQCKSFVMHWKKVVNLY